MRDGPAAEAWFRWRQKWSKPRSNAMSRPCSLNNWTKTNPLQPAMWQLRRRKGDAVAARILLSTGKRLGETMAILVDILNPERIVIGGLAMRLGETLLGPAREVMQREALPVLDRRVPGGAGGSRRADRRRRRAVRRHGLLSVRSWLCSVHCSAAQSFRLASRKGLRAIPKLCSGNLQS